MGDREAERQETVRAGDGGGRQGDRRQETRHRETGDMETRECTVTKVHLRNIVPKMIYR